MKGAELIGRIAWKRERNTSKRTQAKKLPVAPLVSIGKNTQAGSIFTRWYIMRCGGAICKSQTIAWLAGAATGSFMHITKAMTGRLT